MGIADLAAISELIPRPRQQGDGLGVPPDEQCVGTLDEHQDGQRVAVAELPCQVAAVGQERVGGVLVALDEGDPCL